MFGKLAQKDKSYSYTCSFIHSIIHLFIHSFIWQELIEASLWIANVSGALTGWIRFGKEGFLWVPTVYLC